MNHPFTREPTDAYSRTTELRSHVLSPLRCLRPLGPRSRIRHSSRSVRLAAIHDPGCGYGTGHFLGRSRCLWIGTHAADTHRISTAVLLWVENRHSVPP